MEGREGGSEVGEERKEREERRVDKRGENLRIRKSSGKIITIIIQKKS